MLFIDSIFFNFLGGYQVWHCPRGCSQVPDRAGSLDTSWGGIIASTSQGVATLITPRGPYTVEGPRWHLLFKIFSSAENFKADLEAELLTRESLDEDRGYHSFSWQFLRHAQKVFGAKTYCV